MSLLGEQIIMATKSFPRPRGDEPLETPARPPPGVVFPARAGMSRPSSAHSSRGHCFPRPRGDEPEAFVKIARK